MSKVEIKLKHKDIQAINKKTVDGMREVYEYAETLDPDGGIYAIHNTLHMALKAFFLYGLDNGKTSKGIKNLITSGTEYILDELIGQILSEAPFKQLLETEIIADLKTQINDKDNTNPEILQMRKLFDALGVNVDAADIMVGNHDEVLDKIAAIAEASRATKQ